jgi:FtsP/CotA-like multicopper oxidase with cupredoxin domain
MILPYQPKLNRRTLLAGGAALFATSTFPQTDSRASSTREYKLLPAPARVRIVDRAHPETAVWAYAGQVPGPEIRVRQGERLRLVVQNN